MSYGAAEALQAAVFQRLVTDGAVAALSGGAVFDRVPPGARPAVMVSLGPEEARDRSDATGPGAEHDFNVSVETDAAGFATAKALAGAVTDALSGADLALARGHLVGLWFLRARARRAGAGDRRRIDLTFRARVDLG
jgi:hypothetical protein